MNELIVSIYDGGYGFSYMLNGKRKHFGDKKQNELSNLFDSFMGYQYKEINNYCRENNIDRLILCVDGDIKVFNYKK